MAGSMPVTKVDFTDAFSESFYECQGSSELVAAFGQRAVKIACSEDLVLFNHGQPGETVYVVLTGEVGLLLPLSSQDGVGFRARAGSFIGLPAAFSNQPFSMTAIAWKGTELAVMSRERFVDMIATSPALSMDVLRILAAETRAARIAIVEVELGSRRSTVRG